MPGWMKCEGVEVVDGVPHHIFRVRYWHPGFWVFVMRELVKEKVRWH